MTVEGCTETFLIKVVTDETDGATEDEEAVEGTNLIEGRYEESVTKQKRTVTRDAP